jgi:plasmid stabilization system protein ParE
LREAVLWYRERDPALADRFLYEVYKTLELIGRFPGSGGPVFAVEDRTIRQLPVNDFPYQIVFQRLEHRTAVLAIAHERRKPGYWND